MPKVSPITQRKTEHIIINLEKDVQSSNTTGLERFRFIHQALPELDIQQIDITLNLFGKCLNAPILISPITGGTKEAFKINQHLAEAAQATRIAMGIGSQRAALEDSQQIPSFQIARKVAPDILLFANLGAIQLNYGYTIDQCRQAVDMIEADALILHLNPLQEAVQYGGNTNFLGLAAKIEAICNKLEVPVIVKEVGWGISTNTAKVLSECGVSVIDVAGSGGTSWSQVEMHRAPDDFYRQLSSIFSNWGISTADSILNVRKAAPESTIFASGGLQNGLDIAKCLSLGARLGGMARIFLKAASVSTDKVVDMIKLTQQQILITLFAAGIDGINSLKKANLIEN